MGQQEPELMLLSDVCTWFWGPCHHAQDMSLPYLPTLGCFFAWAIAKDILGCLRVLLLKDGFCHDGSIILYPRVH